MCLDGVSIKLRYATAILCLAQRVRSYITILCVDYGVNAFIKHSIVYHITKDDMASDGNGLCDVSIPPPSFKSALLKNTSTPYIYSIFTHLDKSSKIASESIFHSATPNQTHLE